MDLTRALGRAKWTERPRVSRDEGCLMGSRCLDCQTVSWPGRAVCHRCGSALIADVPLPAEGTLVASTVVHVPRPGLPAPYVLGQIELEDGLRIYALVRDVPEGFRSGPVRLVVPQEPDAIPIFWFTCRD
jgi:uncharacterized protein